MNAGDFRIVGVGALGGRDDAQGRDGFTVLGPLNVLWELIAIRVGSGHLYVDTITGRRRAQRHVGANGDGFAMNHRDGDAVANVEASTADLVGLNTPFADHGGFPSHAVQQQLGRDVLGIASSNVDLNPGQSVGRDAVVVSVVEVR